MARKGGIPKRSVVKIISKEKRIQTIIPKSFGSGVAVVRSEFRENLPKATNFTTEDVFNIYGEKALVPTRKPASLFDIEKFIQQNFKTTKVKSKPLRRTIARQKGFMTIGEINKARGGRRIDPFGTFK